MCNTHTYVYFKAEHPRKHGTPRRYFRTLYYMYQYICIYLFIYEFLHIHTCYSACAVYMHGESAVLPTPFSCCWLLYYIPYNYCLSLRIQLAHMFSARFAAFSSCSSSSLSSASNYHPFLLLLQFICRILLLPWLMPLPLDKLRHAQTQNDYGHLLHLHMLTGHFY